MSVDYQVIEQQGALINKSFPYTRIFFSSNRAPTDTAYLTISALTGYNTANATDSANVLVNGVVIGRIWPTFVSAASSNPYLGVEMTLPFHNSILTAPIFGIGFNTLAIVPQGNVNDPINYVIVTTIICTYKQT
jgi:hypothetical protein